MRLLRALERTRGRLSVPAAWAIAAPLLPPPPSEKSASDLRIAPERRMRLHFTISRFHARVRVSTHTWRGRASPISGSRRRLLIRGVWFSYAFAIQSPGIPQDIHIPLPHAAFYTRTGVSIVTGLAGIVRDYPAKVYQFAAEREGRGKVSRLFNVSQIIIYSTNIIGTFNTLMKPNLLDIFEHWNAT